MIKLNEQTKPLLPNRSSLASLKPEGMGTPVSEAATSYVCRLSETHSISPGTLLSHLIFPYMGLSAIAESMKRGSSRIYSRHQAFNGTSDFAMKVIRSLESLTLRKSLIYLTLLPLRNILTFQNVFRPSRAWCPRCLEERRTHGLPAYEALIWLIRAVKVCPVHHTPLITCCNRCGNTLPVITRFSKPGFCSQCGNWLGSDGLPLEQQMELITSFDSWTIKNIGQLLKSLPSAFSLISSENMQAAIIDHINRNYRGSASLYAGALGIQRANVKRWRSGLTLPSFEHILRICYRGNTPLIDFLTKGTLNHDIASSDHHFTPSLFPHSLKNSKEFYPAKIRRSLESILKSKSSNSPSMTKVAEKLGHTKKTLYKHFPALCRHIAAKAAKHRKNCTEQRLTQEKLFVEAAVEQLHLKGIYPGYSAIEKMSTKKGILRSRETREAWREKLCKLEYGSDA